MAATVLHATRELGASLLIIGNDVRPGLARLLPGGHVDAIIRNAPCPVVLVRPPEAPPKPVPPLRSFEEDAARAGRLEPHAMGLRTVEVARIVGVAGDPAQLGADFRPLRRVAADESHFEQTVKAMQRGDPLPLVDLYKLGYGYYVVRGHQQVAAMKQLHQLWLDATVVEFVPAGDAEAQQVFAERLAFEQNTGLTRIGAAQPGTYALLEASMREYAEREEIDDAREAAARWYAITFRPLQQRLRALRLGERLPGHRSADVFARLVEHRRRELSDRARWVSWEEALATFWARSGPDAELSKVA